MRSATISIASSRRSRRSVRQSRASSTADALEVAAVLFELGFEAREEREGVGGGAGEAGQDRVVVEPPDLAGALLEDGVAERDLAVAGEHRLVLVADGEDGRRVNHAASMPQVGCHRGRGVQATRHALGGRRLSSR